MTTNMKQKFDTDKPAVNIKSFFSSSTNVAPRRTLQVLQPSATSGCLVGRVPESRLIPKRKLWGAEQLKTCKKANTEAAVDPEHNENVIEGNQKEAYELMVKANPPSIYWKELAEERRKALYEALQENERLHKEVEHKDEEILKLKKENEELVELAEHVQYMANVIERLTGQNSDTLEALKNLDLDEDHQDAEEDDHEENTEDCEDDSSVSADERQRNAAN
ncbi:geminin isoform X1 [Latimeria chalumnae]|uniref:Geminin DNA replication inhibitor n=1 Tax=Latimeria chalumnae TaxID=7897 RepID=H3AGP0_LATCH|nr:PREDICTED: geminin isoform X1 [Latimeria chalumnae]XP_006009247.1 PREDICTED: geminin isoform X1 [Latimeria chalumnae]XP_014352039.1 PREDICTED: geminin isoform X1 [Latimeria chalumnae]XP_014352040.1 PREDICTED: geminin isoform X1 [Latimeria chalumnae]|eukprot:XP_006009246.1 PREDICTED: geminin isoform X1 [Latimeria chalumnae]